jgi:tetratricopeptide (TPR) repeat protein
MTTNALALKEEGNLQFAQGEYAAAIAKYEIALYCKTDPTLRLVLLTSRLNACNKTSCDSIKARNDLRDFLQDHRSDDWTREFGYRKVCKAYFHLSQTYELEGDPASASDMLQTCLYLQPHDRDVEVAWDRVQRAGAVELARLGFFSHGTAATLLIGGQICALCLEDVSPGAFCILYHCGHGFHDKCAASWMQFEGEEEEGIIGDWQWLEEHPKKTCPCCRAEVMNEKRSNECAGLAAMATVPQGL